MKEPEPGEVVRWLATGFILSPSGALDPDSNTLACLSWTPSGLGRELLEAKWQPTEWWAVKEGARQSRKQDFGVSQDHSTRNLWGLRRLLSGSLKHPGTSSFLAGQMLAHSLNSPWLLSIALYPGPWPQRSPSHRSILIRLPCICFSANNKNTREKGTLFSRAFIIRGQWLPGGKKTPTSKFCSGNQT